MIVNTSYGDVQGKRKGETVRFLGIPYAKPPVGEKRFLPPEEPDPWAGVRLCDRWPKGSLQVPYKETCFSEDSLYLNIWRPAETKGPLPVMVWIHGGSYAEGSTSDKKEDGDDQLYDMEEFCAETQTVVVSMNYRMNVMGFCDLTALDPSFTINNGLRDIVAALRWVRQEIGSFGGDSDNVTVFGQSAGGGLALALLGIPEARDLFQKIICQSSGELGYLDLAEGKKRAGEWLSRMGDPSAEDLIRMPPEKLLSKIGTLNREFLKTTLDCYYAPILDGEFFVDRPTHLSFANDPVSVLIGWNRREASVFLQFLPDRTQFRRTKGLSVVLPYQSQMARERIMENDPKFPCKESYIRIATERMYSVPITQFAEHMSHYADVYVYRFDADVPMTRLLGISGCHGAELGMLFGNQIRLFGVPMSLFGMKTANKVGTRLRNYWGNFAREGQPCNAWERYDPERQNVWVIKEADDKIVEHPLGHIEDLYIES